MDLHRASRRPDWARRRKRDYSFWQQLAARTNGVVTPGNIITVAGFMSVLYGLLQVMQRHWLSGILAVGIGRFCDVLDGYIANQTGTKSRLGEVLDAGLDKFATVLGLITLGVAQVAPWWLLICLALPHALITIIVVVARRRQQNLHPSRSGKLSMAAAWFSLGCLLLNRTLGNRSTGLLAVTAYSLAAIAVVGGIAAGRQYARQLYVTSSHS